MNVEGWERRKWDVVVLGGINTDYVVRGRVLPGPGQSIIGDEFARGPGGKGANQAVAAARLGGRVAMIGCVGGDPRGREMVENLKREGVEARHVSYCRTARTGAAVIAVNAKGEKQISAALGANLAMKPAQIRAAKKLIAGARVLLCNLEVPFGCVMAAAEAAAESGTLVVLDPAPPRRIPLALLHLVYAIRPNADEAEHLTGVKVRDRASALAAAVKLRAWGRGARWVILEAGAGGNLLLTEDEEIFLPRCKVRAVDATGAGDAFAGALAVGIAEGMSPREAGSFATVTAALSTTRMGAQDALPARKEVERVLRGTKGIV